jgi:hypothetical protein
LISAESCVSILTNSSCILTSFNNPDFHLFFLAVSQLSFHGKPLMAAARKVKRKTGPNRAAGCATSYFTCSHGKKI